MCYFEFCRTYIDPSWMRRRAFVCLTIGMLLILIGIAVTVCVCVCVCVCACTRARVCVCVCVYTQVHYLMCGCSQWSVHTLHSPYVLTHVPSPPHYLTTSHPSICHLKLCCPIHVVIGPFIPRLNLQHIVSYYQ